MTLLRLTIFSVILGASLQETAEVVDVEGRIWGPGLDPRTLVLPARYLFLELVGNYSAENDGPAIEFKVIGKTLDKERPCRAWSNVLNRRDGSYILRYKMYEPCKDLEIHIKYKDKHLGDSPYSVDGVVYPENCVCPMRDVDEWISRVDCGKIPDQINKDLSQFTDIDWNKIRNKVIKRYNKPDSVSICHYVIKNNEIHRKCYGKYVGFKMFMDSILLSLTRKMVLPDLEFFSNLGDWPLVKDDSPILPIFSWCGSRDTYDIVMPTYDLTESTIENMGRVMLDMLSVQGNTPERWEKRIPKIFWRGRDSNLERLKLIDISRKHPELFNVSMTNFFFYRDQQEKYGPKADHVSFYTFFDYKYQVSIDGTVAAYRFPYLLAGGSLIFKQNSKYYEHFYNEISPGIHYIPVEQDLSDLMEKINWALANNEEAAAIAENAKAYANNNLLPKDIFCYHAFLLSKFAKLIKSEVRMLKDMEKVEQPDDAKNCNCHRNARDEL